MTPPTLYQFSYSHVAEAVRWSLDHKAIPWNRTNMLPGRHMAKLVAMTGQRRIPVLEHSGERVAGCPAILSYIDATWSERPLRANTSEVSKRIRWFYDLLARPLRDAWFPLILEDTSFCAAAFSIGRSPTERAAYRTMFPVIRRAISMAWGLSPTRARDAQAEVLDALTTIERELPEPGLFLVGDTLSAADILLSALISPLIQPGWSPFRLQDRLPEPARMLQNRVAERPILVWVRSLYASHRGHSMAENSEIEGSGVL
ncbi:MAG: glutathione S-transferase [Myxococcota bacterium]|nr:glutathione S-transferase [Myxococcota bacterium]